MERIDTADHRFEEGDLITGELGTPVPASWLIAVQEELAQAIEGLGGVLDATKHNQLLTQLLAKFNVCLTQTQADMRYCRQYASGVALPTQNIGTIWHDDYNSWMTWQTFTANGAAYAGYASVLVGHLLQDTQPTPRAGYIKSGTANLSRTAYAALRGWAMHNGIMVALGTWAAGTIAVCDNADGTTFKAFDVRGEFPRFWDDSRGVDSGRATRSWQDSQNKSHSHGAGTSSDGAQSGFFDLTTDSGGSLLVNDPNGIFTVGNGNWGISVVGSATGQTRKRIYASIPAHAHAVTVNADGGNETRPRNVAMLASIKF